MRDSFTSSNSDDFRQRYVGTYGRYTLDSGKKITVSITEMDSNTLYFEDLAGAQFSTKVNSGVEFEFYPVNKILKNYRDTILYSTRRPARQWQRGMSSANTTVIDIGRGEVKLTSKIADILLDPGVDNYVEIYNQYLGGYRKNFLISDKFCVDNQGQVCVYALRIGEYSEGTLKVVPLFIQEVRDAVRRANLQLKVVESE